MFTPFYLAMCQLLSLPLSGLAKEQELGGQESGELERLYFPLHFLFCSFSLFLFRSKEEVSGGSQKHAHIGAYCTNTPKVTTSGCSLKHAFMGVNPILYNGTYFRVNMYRLVLSASCMDGLILGIF